MNTLTYIFIAASLICLAFILWLDTPAGKRWKEGEA